MLPWILLDVFDLRSSCVRGKLGDCKWSLGATTHFHMLGVSTVCTLKVLPWRSSYARLSAPSELNGRVLTRVQLSHWLHSDSLTSEYMDSRPSSCRRMVFDSFMSIVVLMSSSLCVESESESCSRSSPVVDVMSPRSSASCRAVNGWSAPVEEKSTIEITHSRRFGLQIVTC